MDFYSLVDTIRTYCTANDIMFIYGKQELREVHLGGKVVSSELDSNQLVLFAGFNTLPVLQGITLSVSYSGFMMLGRHCEESTSSSIDETQEEKYDRRLKFLISKLASIIGALQCSNDLEITNTIEIEEIINEFDENLDCVQTNISFKH